MQAMLGSIRSHWVAILGVFLIVAALVVCTTESRSAQYMLTINPTVGGTVSYPTVGTHTYSAGTVVDLVASPDARCACKFVLWSGDVSTIGNVTAAVTTITINGNYKITAIFGIAVP
jgi:hypothetical protein